MKVLFHLGHPAHFHLFKNVILKLKEHGHTTDILIKEKDVLKALLDQSGLSYKNVLPEGKSNGKAGLVIDLFRRGSRILSHCRRSKPDLLIGTSADISYVGRILGVPAINVNEDDASVVPFYAWISYPWSSAILSPDCCDNGRWQHKTTTYKGYHELSYLHPDHFTPDKKVVNQYTNPDAPFFVLRFAGLDAHHDDGIKGINNEIAAKLIERLSAYGKIIITSERELSSALEAHRMAINPLDIHHILAFAKIVIGDSQTMSAEAGVLGTPYIRFNDFVGKIGYLKELEETYHLGYGIQPNKPDLLLSKAEELASDDNLREKYNNRREVMLQDKINVADFLFNYISEMMAKQ